MRKGYNYEVSFCDWSKETNIVTNNSAIKCYQETNTENTNNNINCNNREKDEDFENCVEIRCLTRSNSEQNIEIVGNHNNHANQTLDRSLSSALVYESDNYDTKITSNVPLSNFLPSFCYDVNFPNEFSESSEMNSYTDLRLANLHSKLKAETEEIRKWKEETIDNTEKVFRKHTYKCFEFSSDSNKDDIDTIDAKINQISSNHDIRKTPVHFKEKDSQSTINQHEFNIISNELNISNKNIKSFEKEITKLKNENDKLIENYKNQTNYCSELEAKVEMLEESLNQFAKSNEQFNKQHFHEEIERKNNIIKQLQEKLTNEITNREKEIKENVRLKDQQIELKNQMTKLLTYANVTKRESGVKEKIISEFCEEQFKLGEITNNLKMIVNDNKSIFANFSEELSDKNHKLSETIDHMKYLEDKLKVTETKLQSLQSEVDTLTTQNSKLQDTNKNCLRESSEKLEKEHQENSKLLNEIEQLKSDKNSLTERNNSLSRELSNAEESQNQLKVRSDQICRKFEELKMKTSLNQDQCYLFTKKLEDREQELAEVQETLSQLRTSYGVLENEKKILLAENEQLKRKSINLERSCEHEKKAMEKKYVSELESLQNKINSLMNESKKITKNHEKSMNELHKEIMKLESQVSELKQQKSEMVEYLYKLPTSSIKWGHFFQ